MTQKSLTVAERIDTLWHNMAQRDAKYRTIRVARTDAEEFKSTAAARGMSIIRAFRESKEMFVRNGFTSRRRKPCGVAGPK